LTPDRQKLSTGRGGEPARHAIARGLRHDIVNGVLPAGQRIPQEEIARQYNTSRIPVREALRDLEAEGLVTIVRDVGARVAPLDPAELTEAFLMREALEPLAVSHGATQRTEEQLAQMRTALELSEACADEDVACYLQYDRAFHLLTIQASGLHRTTQVIENLWNTTYRHQKSSALMAHRREVGAVEHRLLLDAFECHQAEDAAMLHEMHVRRSRLVLTHLITPHAVQPADTLDQH
jgi:DNA-binding GntR family transcriptional regulator